MYRKPISIAHLNTQSMGSSFDEFQIMINENQFDIVTLSKTWLRSNKHLRDYVKIPGYNFVYKNGEQKRVGGVVAYLKEERDFKTHGHLNKLDTTIEQLWLEIKGEKKKFILIASSLT